MQVGKIKPKATLVAQFPAGVEVDALQHEGYLYLPVTSLGEFAVAEKISSKEEKVPERGVTSKKSVEDDTVKVYTEDEMMEMDSKELIKILKNEFGVNPDDYDGKNTNKKLRDLILKSQGGSKKSKKVEEPEEDDAKETAGDDELLDNVCEILEDFDAGKKNKKKAIIAIAALGKDVDEDAVTEVLESFEDDKDADADSSAEAIVKILSGKKEKKSASAKGKSKTAEKLVEIEDLEVGDRVSVWWDDENQAWYDGEVASIKKGKVTIAYDDDTEDVLDSEVNTKIKRI